MIAPLVRLAGRDERILVGPETADDAGVFLLGGHALVATADFITPALLDELLASGHKAAEVGEVLEGPARIEIV